MKSSVFSWLVCGVVLLSENVLGAEGLDFNRDVRPILSDRCFHCHGPDENTRDADLRLDTADGAFAALNEAGTLFAIVAGDPDASDLYQRIISHDDKLMMPPPDSHTPQLNDKEKAIIKQWIEEGAQYDGLWTFSTPERPELPETKFQDWVRNPIDQFVAEKLEEKGLEPSPEANKETLLRRLSYDLTGLPPTIEELHTFVNDDSPGAYEKVVDRLLASQAYGERMASEWMDAARYADTSGYQYDRPRTMWRWREWVIDSFNENQPYDEFITWQIAGDLLPDATIEQKLATGFSRNHSYTIEGGVIDEEYRTTYVNDRVTTMGTVFLGLTFECARCHDHKFDPVSQKDYYQLFSFFNNAPELGLVATAYPAAPPYIKTPTRDDLLVLEEAEGEMKTIKSAISKAEDSFDQERAAWEEEMATAWKVVVPESMSASSKATMTLNDDQTILVAGEVKAKEAYELKATFPKGETVTALRVEVMQDESLTDGWFNRGEGDIVAMSSMTMFPEGEVRPLKMGRADSDFVMDGYENLDLAFKIRNTLGWTLDKDATDDSYFVQVALAEPFTFEKDTEVTFDLKFISPYTHSSFGKFRVAYTSVPYEETEKLFVASLLNQPQEQRTDEEAERIEVQFRRGLPQFASEQERLTALEAQAEMILKKAPTTMIMSDGRPRKSYILNRGVYDDKGEEVFADTPGNLPPFPEGVPKDRLGLAQWLTSREQPLTARVVTNRFWHQIFGVGIVKTVDDFGSQAEWPSHLELLDWLAVEFMESGWDTKAIIKKMVMSATYRQDSTTTPEQLENDPENRLLARGPRIRLSAEMIRDGALAASGLLNPTVGGPSVKPYQPPGLWAQLSKRKGYEQIYEPDTGEKLYRRGLYTYWKRAAHHPMMSTFDAPAREVCSFSRSSTNTPLQALVLLHDPQFVEAARNLAHHLHEASDAPSDRINLAFQAILARTPSDQEMSVMTDYLDSEREILAQNPSDVEQLLQVGETKSPENIEPVELAATMMVCRAIFNLSETVTKH